MQRAGQTPHGARPNREGARNFGFAHASARRVKPPGRSLEPGSDAGPRGMAVPPERSGGQHSAYRSGCHKLFFKKSSGTKISASSELDWAKTSLVSQSQVWAKTKPVSSNLRSSSGCFCARNLSLLVL